MKAKHNKKRNTAFIYEALIREISSAILGSDLEKKSKILEIFKKHFSDGSVLARELSCYKVLSETNGVGKDTAEKLVTRAIEQYNSLKGKEIFKEQSRLIGNINKHISPSVFSNFVPNYKTYATIAQIFNKNTPIKNKVLMEQDIITEMSSPAGTPPASLKGIDSLVVRTFTDNFNNKFGHLLPEQKNLLGKYILSFDASETDFRVYLSEELTRLLVEVKSSLKMDEVANDPEMVEGTGLLIEHINQFNVSNITESDIKKILKLQKLVREYSVDANHD